MSTITINEARRKGADIWGMKKSASQVLLECVKEQSSRRTYDIFLSHASSDAQIILGVKRILEDVNYSVYIDWIDDPQLDRTKVSPKTAALLRARMDICNSLFFVTTPGSSYSKWMPWECGYFDGKKQKSAILPVTKNATSSYKGQEYLGLYPYVTRAPRESDKKVKLWIHLSEDIYVEYEKWLAGSMPRRH